MHVLSGWSLITRDLAGGQRARRWSFEAPLLHGHCHNSLPLLQDLDQAPPTPPPPGAGSGAGASSAVGLSPDRRVPSHNQGPTSLWRQSSPGSREPASVLSSPYHTVDQTRTRVDPKPGPCSRHITVKPLEASDVSGRVSRLPQHPAPCIDPSGRGFLSCPKGDGAAGTPHSQARSSPRIRGGRVCPSAEAPTVAGGRFGPVGVSFCRQPLQKQSSCTRGHLVSRQGAPLPRSRQ